MAEDFGSPTAVCDYDLIGPCATWFVDHLMQLVAVAAIEAPAGGDTRTLKDTCLAVPLDRIPTPPTTCTSQYKATARSSGRIHPAPDLCRHASDDERVGAGRCHRSSARQAPAVPPGPAPCRLCGAAAADVHGPWHRTPTRPADDQARPLHQCAWYGRPIAPTRRGHRPSRASPARTASKRRGGFSSRWWRRAPPVHGYAPGSWGPSEADGLLAGLRRSLAGPVGRELVEAQMSPPPKARRRQRTKPRARANLPAKLWPNPRPRPKAKPRPTTEPRPRAGVRRRPRARASTAADPRCSPGTGRALRLRHPSRR